MSSTTRTPGASASHARTVSGVIGSAHSTVSAIEWARSTGTRTHVTDTRSAGASMILRVSLITLVSSPLAPVAGSIGVLWLNRLKA